MAYASLPTGAGSKFAWGTVSASTVTVAPTASAGEIVVIDTIIIAGSNSTAVDVTLSEDNILGSVFWRQRAAAGAGFSYVINFPGGWPMWSASGGDSTAADPSFTFTNVSGTLTGQLTIVYHTERQSVIRS